MSGTYRNEHMDSPSLSQGADENQEAIEYEGQEGSNAPAKDSYFKTMAHAVGATFGVMGKTLKKPGTWIAILAGWGGVSSHIAYKETQENKKLDGYVRAMGSDMDLGNARSLYASTILRTMAEQGNASIVDVVENACAEVGKSGSVKGYEAYLIGDDLKRIASEIASFEEKDTSSFWEALSNQTKTADIDTPLFQLAAAQNGNKPLSSSNPLKKEVDQKRDMLAVVLNGYKVPRLKPDYLTEQSKQQTAMQTIMLNSILYGQFVATQPSATSITSSFNAAVIQPTPAPIAMPVPDMPPPVMKANSAKKPASGTPAAPRKVATQSKPKANSNTGRSK